MCFLVSIAVICTFILTLTLCYPLFFEHTKQEVKDEATYLTYVFNHHLTDPKELLKDAQTQTRITWIDPEGNVIFDNSAEPDKMENHLLRQEVQIAQKVGTGESYRISTTLGTNTYYYAVRLDDNSVLRLSRNNVSAYDMVQEALPILLAMMLLIYLTSLLAARRMARNIIAPINSINLEHPIMNDLYEELNPMLIRLENQNEQIHQQMKTLKNQQREFTMIINNIEEGLILINHSYKILAINHSVLNILNAEKIDYIDKNLFTLINNETLYQAAQNVMRGERQEFYLPLDKKTYQIIASPVTKHNTVKGALILFVDITEKRMAEKMRQEFSANVSHELKTPLTSIRGYTELIRSHTIQDSAQIDTCLDCVLKESDHMTQLINDILTISKLETEEMQVTYSHIQVKKLLDSVVETLKPQIEAMHLNVYVNATEFTVFASLDHIKGIFYNLISNAIKYNKQNGRIDVVLKKNQKNMYFSVEDTGVGIAQEDQSRIFQRFYRVDKERSKTIPGTGLGLSIVKHVVYYYQGKIHLTSKEDVGTKITVELPIIVKEIPEN